MKGELQTPDIPSVRGHCLHPLPGDREEDSKEAESLCLSATERGLEIQSSAFLWALTHPRASIPDLQTAVCSADDLLKVFGAAISTQHSAEPGRGLGEGMPMQEAGLQK